MILRSMYKQIIGYVFVAFFISIFFGCGVSKKTIPVRQEWIINKAPLDNSEYRYIMLENGLKVVLVSDVTAYNSAACLNVAVGNYQDPEERQGLAHFLEHMLFINNEKYPEVDGYAKFITKNGGSSNAYTARNNTVYYFDINNDEFNPALDRLSQFFISPKLDAEYVDRERHAVDSEYRMKIKDEYRRLMEVFYSTINPNHPASRFSVGNLDTLNNEDGKSLRADLKAFYNNYYRASNMTLAVSGSEKLDTLEAWVRKYFSDIRGGKRPDIQARAPMYTSKELGVKLNIIPLKEMKELNLYFPLPDMSPYYKNDPISYIEKMLNNRKAGSLYSLLMKDRHWITDLAVKSDTIPGEQTELWVSMDLTESGIKNTDEITGLFFDYVKLIRDYGVKESLYDELAQMRNLEFQFDIIQSSLTKVIYLANNTHHVPVKDLLGVQHISYNADLMYSVLNDLRPEKMRQIVVAKGLPANKEEPYYQTKYQVMPLSKETLKKLNLRKKNSRLSIPSKNPFIPEDYTLKTKDHRADITPILFYEKPGFLAWGLTDISFSVPKGQVMISISTPQTFHTPERLLASHIYSMLLKTDKQFSEYLYAASEGGTSFISNMNSCVLSFSISGYQDKQRLIIPSALTMARNLKINETDFKLMKEDLMDQIKNLKFRKPYSQLIRGMLEVLYPESIEPNEMLKVLDKITLKSVQSFINDFYKQAHVKMMVYGNYNEKESMALALDVEKALYVEKPLKEPFKKSFNLLRQSNITLDMDVQHNDSAIVIYYQGQETNVRERAKYALLARLFSMEFFTQLRTEQQLGYIVTASNKLMEQYPGTLLMIQSPNHNPVVLEEKIYEFLSDFRKTLKNMTEIELRMYKKGLIQQVTRKDLYFEQRANRLWSNIVDSEPFDINKRIGKEINKVELIELMQLYDDILRKKHRMVVRSWGESFLKDRNLYKNKRKGVCHSSMECRKKLRVAD